MALAKCSSPASHSHSVGATLTLKQITVWDGIEPPHQAPTWRGSIGCGSWGASAFFYTQWVEDEEYELYLRRTLTTSSAPQIENVLAGTMYWDDDEHDYVGVANYSQLAQTYSGSVSPYYLYKQRGFGIQKEVDEDLTSPVHSLHGWVAYAWGNPGTGTMTKAATWASLSSSGTTSLTPSINTDSNGVPVGGGGTQDLPSVTLTLGLSAKPRYSVSGEVARWDGVSISEWGDYSGDVPPNGKDVSRNGLRWYTSGGAYILEITDWTAIPANGDTETITLYPPTIAEYDLQGYDWNTSYSGLQFSIGATDGSGGREAVSNGYYDTTYYWKTSYDSPSRSRLWMADVQLDSTWAASAGENVDPPDLKCVLEERGLSGPTGDWTWTGFGVRRWPDSMQLPSDAGGTPPSAWFADDANLLHVSQDGKDTNITVEPTASGNSISRLLVGVYGGDLITKHTALYDVRSLENFGFLKVQLTSAQPQNLTLSITHTDGTDSWPLAVQGTGTTETFYLDLCLFNDPRRHLCSKLELSGFTGTSEAFAFTLEEIIPQPYNPTDAVETGYWDTKVVFPRPNTGGVPIHSVAATFTAEGRRAIWLPASESTVFTEGGLESYVTNVDVPAMLSLGTWWTRLRNQEGIHCSGSSDPTVTGQSAYDAAFVDADSNDMLGGLMYCGDAKEAFDLSLGTHASTYTTLPCCVRVGRIYLAAGVAIDCRVRKHIRGSVHGRLARGGGRAPAGQTITLWEQDTTTLAWTQVATTTTDDWARYAFSDGGRELDKVLRAIAGSNAPTDGALAGYNELRRWVIEVALGGPDMCRDLLGRRWYVCNDSDGNVHVYLRQLDTGEWEDKGEPFDSSYLSQAIQVRDDGCVIVAATPGTGTVLSAGYEFADAGTDGVLTWQTLASVQPPESGTEVVDMASDLLGRRWCIADASSGFPTVWRQDQATGAWDYAGLPFGGSYREGRAIAVLDDGRVLVAGEDSGVTYLSVGYEFADASTDGQLTWALVATAQPLGNDLTQCCFDQRGGLTVCSGYAGGKCYIEQSWDGGETQARLDNGTGAAVYRYEVCSADEVRAPIALRDDGKMEVSPTVAGSVRTYRGDLANGFASVQY